VVLHRQGPGLQVDEKSGYDSRVCAWRLSKGRRRRDGGKPVGMNGRTGPDRRALFLILGRETPSSRYRVLQYLPFLEEAGISPSVVEAPRSWSEKLSFIKDLPAYDFVFVQKKLFRLLEWRYIRARAANLVFDFDDAIIFRDTFRGAGISAGRRRCFNRMIGDCDLVIAGNDYLRGLAEGSAERLCTIPTPVDMRRYSERRPPRKGAPLTIGWIGSGGTLFYLERLHEVLRAVCRAVPGTRIKVVSNAFPQWPDLPMIRKGWCYEEEIADLHSFDIGIMPLTDDPWSRGKCGFKLIQYMAVGLPAVCSPVGMNLKLIDHGISGILAPDHRGWFHALQQLIHDPALRRRLGQAGRRKVAECYSLQRCAPRLVEALTQI
jgi:glycosyltransferase involved in cell wall biosynthesis